MVMDISQIKFAGIGQMCKQAIEQGDIPVGCDTQMGISQF